MNDSPDTVTAADLATFFAGVGRAIDAAEARPTFDEPAWREFFGNAAGVIDAAEARRREVNRLTAGGFNVFRLIDPDENKLSDVLADLLDPRGTHGQGDQFLRLLLKLLGLDPDVVLLPRVRVMREAPAYIGERVRRIDILVDAGVLVAIENKAGAADQYRQVEDYLTHLRHTSKEWSVPAKLIYLTPDGSEPTPDSLSVADTREHRSAGRLCCWRYASDLRGWLEDCRSACRAVRIRHFLRDFVGYIETDLRRAPATLPSYDEP